EEEQRVVAGTAEVTVVGRALLMAVGLAHRTVHVQDELRELAVLMGLVDPLAGEVHQVLEVLLGAESLGLEAGHLTGGSRRTVLGAATVRCAAGKPWPPRQRGAVRSGAPSVRLLLVRLRPRRAGLPFTERADRVFLSALGR